MLRMIALPALILCLAGCTAGSVMPGTLPDGATSGIYTMNNAQAVASCIANAIGSNVQPVGDRLVIVSIRHPGVSYSVGPNDRKSVYPTQVAVTGMDNNTDDAKQVAGCVVPQGQGNVSPGFAR